MNLSHRSPSLFVGVAILAGLAGCAASSPGDDGAAGAGVGGDNGGGEQGQSGGAAGSDPVGGQSGGAGDGGNQGGGGAGSSAAGNGGASSSGGSGGQSQTGGTGGSQSGGTGGSPPANVPCSQRVYCNDFDSANPGSTPSGVETTNGSTITVATDKKFSGSNSLKIVAKPASSGIKRARFKVDLASKLKDPKKISYMRMMIYMDNVPDGTVNGHWDVFSMQGNTDSKGQVTLGVGGGQHPTYPIARWLYLASGTDCSKQTTPGIPLQKWVCLEVKIDERDAKPYGVNIGGAAVAGLTFGTDPDQDACVADGFGGVWHVPRVVNYWWGWSQWHTQKNAVTFWIDDIVVDQQPIGCPQ